MKIEINTKKILSEGIPVLGVLLFVFFTFFFILDFSRFLIELNTYQLDNEIVSEIKSWGFIISLTLIINYFFMNKKNDYPKYGFILLFSFLIYKLDVFSFLDTLLVLPESSEDLNIENRLSLFAYQPYISFTILLLITVGIFIIRIIKGSIKNNLFYFLPILIYFILVNISFNVIEKTLFTKLMLHNITIVDNAIKNNGIELVCKEEKFTCVEEKTEKLLYKSHGDNLYLMKHYIKNNIYKKETVINIDNKEYLLLKRDSVYLVIKDVFYYERENVKLLENLLIGVFSFIVIILLWTNRIKNEN